MKVHAATIADLEPLLDSFLAHGHTTSSFVVSTPVPAPTRSCPPGLPPDVR